MEKYSIVDQDETRSDKVELKEALVEMITERIFEECSLPKRRKMKRLKKHLKFQVFKDCDQMGQVLDPWNNHWLKDKEHGSGGRVLRQKETREPKISPL